MILAQRFAQAKVNDLFRNPGRKEQEIFDWCMGLINPPMSDSDPMLVSNYQARARRFILDESPFDVIQPFLDNKSLTPRAIAQMARLPYDATWVEWLNGPDRVAAYNKLGNLDSRMIDRSDREGFLALQLDGKTYFVHFLGLDKKLAVPYLAYVHDDTLPLTESPDGGGGYYTRVLWLHPGLQNKEQEEILTRNCVIMSMDALFLLVTPKVSEITDVIHAPKLQKRRAKEGKPPFLDYLSVKMKIGKSRASRRTGAASGQMADAVEAGKRRYHDVVGHFRNRNVGGVSQVSYVPSHFRGNPELGIIIKDRRMVSDSRPSPK